MLNGLTRLAVETSPATGALAAIGFEPVDRTLAAVQPATQRLAVGIGADGICGADTLAA